MNAKLDALVAWLRDAQRILAFTGAGISTASGIPDYRGPQGVWTRRQPVYYDDFLRSAAARVEYWDYKLEGWPALQTARPNAVHHAIVQLQRAGKLRMVITQNVDGLHQMAGSSPGKLVELHGNSRFAECQSCGRRSDVAPHFDAFARTRQPPLCACGGLLKPATISFGQALREQDVVRAETAAHDADLVIALGSTLSVYPAAGLPLLAARRGAPYLIINRGPTDHDRLPEVTLRLEADVAETFPPAVARALL
jgi:NAD-dependent deacetylase